VRELIHNKCSGRVNGDGRQVDCYEIGVKLDLNGRAMDHVVTLSEEEARKLQAWLTEKLPSIEGCTF
jgi:hypothetical protein